MLTALIFGAVHGSVSVMIDGFVAGMIFSYVYIVKGSIIAPILLHMCNNALAYALTILSYNEKSLLELVDSEAYFLIIYVVSAVIVSVAMVGVVVRLVRVRRQEPTA
jgi:membrane protease YdiL (CAAX protease family)